MCQSDEIAKIISMVCEDLGVPKENVFGNTSRLREIVQARYIIVYFIKQQFPDLTDLRVGKIIGLGREAVQRAKSLAYDRYADDIARITAGRNLELF
jgi:hypothetical protein